MARPEAECPVAVCSGLLAGNPDHVGQIGCHGLCETLGHSGIQLTDRLSVGPGNIEQFRMMDGQQLRKAESGFACARSAFDGSGVVAGRCRVGRNPLEHPRYRGLAGV